MATKKMADDAGSAGSNEAGSIHPSVIGEGMERAIDLARAQLRQKGLTDDQIDAILSRSKARDLDW